MDITALSQLSGASTSSAAAVPVDTRTILSNIAASTTISDSDKGALVAAVAQIDSGLTGTVRTQALQQVEGLGVYLRNTGTDGYPRWPMMTALRAYGLNLTPGTTNSNTTTVVKALESHLERIAQGHSVSLSKATAAATTLGREARYVAPAPAPHVEVKTPAPAPITTTKVDTTA